MDSDTCKICPLGFYGDVLGQKQSPFCKSCPRGMVGKNAGAQNDSTCLHCTVGRYSDQDGRALRSEAGLTWEQLLANDCQPCPKGRYSTTVGATKESLCVACNVGRFSSVFAASDASACLPCNIGRFSVIVGSVHIDTCTKCPEGFHQHETGKPYCLACVPGNYQGK